MYAQQDIIITHKEIIAQIVIRLAIVALEIYQANAQAVMTVIYYKFRVQPVRKAV